MRGVRNVLNYVRHLSSSKLLIGGLFTLAVVISGGVVLSQQIRPAEAATCRPDNDIINCGVTSKEDFVAKCQANAPGDLHNIYRYYGLQTCEEVGQRAVMGTAYKDGTVKVNGQVVATNAHSLGRQFKPYAQKLNIAGKDYYQSASKDVFASDSLQVLVIMNGDQFKYAIIMACGNPLNGTPNGTAPSFSCDGLSANIINNKDNEFRFNAAASAKGGANITGYQFDYGDGTSERWQGNLRDHTYAKPGTYNATVKVYVTANGQEQLVSGDKCNFKVTVPEKPIYDCKNLTALIEKEGERTYNYTLTYLASGGATLNGVDFNFGDGTSNDNVKPESDTIVKTKHTYAKMGDYKTVATLHFNVNGKVEDKKCEVSLNVPEKPCVDNPGKPECNPCPQNPSVPKDSPECNPPAPEVPQEIAKTGPAEIIGGTLGLGSLAGAGYYFRTSRRNLISKLLNR